MADAFRGRWPGAYRAALCVSIDVDGPYGELNYRPADDTYWLSQTTYDPRGTVRLLRILADLDVAGTFCWVGRAAEDQPELVRQAVVEGHEIALHSWDHRPANRMTAEAQRADMERTQAVLTELAGVPCVGHKTASWRYDDTTHAVAQSLGLRWVMDVPDGDLPTLLAPDPGLLSLVNLPPSRMLDDYTYLVDGIETPGMILEAWRDDLDVIRDDGGLMCLTLHPFVSGRPGPSQAMKHLVDYAIGLGDIWIARADHIADHWRAIDP